MRNPVAYMSPGRGAADADSVVDRLLGLDDGPTVPVLLAAGRYLTAEDPDRVSKLAVALAADDRAGIVAGLDGKERGQLLLRARRDGIDVRDRDALYRWLTAHPDLLPMARRRVGFMRNHRRRGVDKVLEACVAYEARHARRSQP